MQNLHTTAMDGGSVENVGTIFNHYVHVDNRINRMFQDEQDTTKNLKNNGVCIKDSKYLG